MLFRSHAGRAALRLGLGGTTRRALSAAGLAAAGDPLERAPAGLSAAEALVQHLARLVAAGDLAA